MWRRLFEKHGYQVRFVQNFTNIDDKIIKRSNEKGISAMGTWNQLLRHFLKDMDALGIKRADVYPKATESIQDMQALIQTLIEKGAAYEANGTVFFSVEAKADYGKLSHKVLDDLESGSRVEVNELKA